MWYFHFGMFFIFFIAAIFINPPALVGSGFAVLMMYFTR